MNAARATRGTRPARRWRSELAAHGRTAQTRRMTPPREDSPDQPDAAPLGSEVSRTDPDDDAMAGPVYPPPETEPDAH